MWRSIIACRWRNSGYCYAIWPRVRMASADRPKREPSAHEHALSLSEGKPMEHLEAIGTPLLFRARLQRDAMGNRQRKSGQVALLYREHRSLNPRSSAAWVSLLIFVIAVYARFNWLRTCSRSWSLIR